jgi:ribosomal protein S18 acetylase RimI-like enzyme
MTHDAHRHRTGSTPQLASSTGPTVLRGVGVSCRVRAWPGHPDIAQLVLYQQAVLPTIDDLERWSTQLAGVGFQRVRTSAMSTASGVRMEAAGFHSIQDLVLLQFDQPRRIPAADATIRRLDDTRHHDAALVDAAAFGDEWSLDPTAIVDVRHATPSHRARVAIDRRSDRRILGYAVSGRDARQGFLQRLAVHPDAQRQGLGRALVLDSLRWASRWRVDRVLVNTHTTNDAALDLYESVGFHRLREQLHVFERSLAWSRA